MLELPRTMFDSQDYLTTDVPFGSKTFPAAVSKDASLGSSGNNDGGHFPFVRISWTTFIVS